MSNGWARIPFRGSTLESGPVFCRRVASCWQQSVADDAGGFDAKGERRDGGI